MITLFAVFAIFRFFHSFGNQLLTLFISNYQLPINIRVKKWRIELALWRAAWVVFLERHRQPVVSAFPRRLFLTWNYTFPMEQVKCSVALFHRFCYKPKRVIFSPSLSLFGESGNRDSGHILDFCFEVRQLG